MSKVIKNMELEDLRSTFKEVRDMVFLSIEKLDSQGDYLLRKTMRDKQIRLKLVKNSLTRKVFKELNIQVPDKSEYWKKNTVVAFGPASVSQLSRELDSALRNPKTVAKYKETVTVKGAIADGQPISFDLAKTMPTREELIGQIVGMILGPAQAIAGCLTGPVSQVASQIEQISEKKEETAEAPAAS